MTTEEARLWDALVEAVAGKTTAGNREAAERLLVEQAPRIVEMLERGERERDDQP